MDKNWVFSGPLDRIRNSFFSVTFIHKEMEPEEKQSGKKSRPALIKPPDPVLSPAQVHVSEKTDLQRPALDPDFFSGRISFVDTDTRTSFTQSRDSLSVPKNGRKSVTTSFCVSGTGMETV